MLLAPVFSRTAARSALLLGVVLLVSGCAGPRSATADLDERLLGVWATEGGARYTITAEEGEYALGIVDYDDEVFEVRSVTWDDGVLAWTYHVPSTGYDVSEETTSISEDRLDLQWENQTGATGTDVLTRVE